MSGNWDLENEWIYFWSCVQTSKCVCVGNSVEMVREDRGKIMQSDGQINE